MSSDSFHILKLPSLESQKIGSLAASGEDKLARLKGRLEVVNDLPEDTGITDNLWNIFKSSVVREGGVQADIGREIQNLFGGNADTTSESGFSSPLEADKYVGLDPSVRQEGQRLQTNVMEDIARGDWWNLPGSIAEAAPFTAADSGGSFVAGLAGVLGTAAAGAAGGNLLGAPLAATANIALRGKRLGDSISDTLKEYQKVKQGLDILGDVGKTASQASVMVAGDVERQVQDYRAETGENPSGARLSGMVLGSFITNTAQVGVFKNLMLPKGKESLKEIQSLVRTMRPDKSAVVSIASRIRDGVTKIGVAGGAEAAQEYVQTWQQILSKNVNPETGQSLADAVLEELQNPENQLEAATGAALGLGAGGLTKSVTTAPAMGVGIGTDAAVGAVKGTYNVTKDATGYLLNKSARSKLSEEEKRDLRNQYDNASEIVRLKNKDLNRQLGTIRKATTLDDLKADPEIAKVIAKAQESPQFSDEALQDRVAFREFKDIMILNNRKAQEALSDSLESSSLSSFRGRGGKPSTAYTRPITAEETETLVTSIAPKGEAAVQAARELESPLAINTINKISAEAKGTVEVSERVLTQAKQLSVHDLDRVAAIVSDSHPEIAKKLNKLANTKAKALERFTPSKSKIIDDSNFDEILAKVADEGIGSDIQMRAVSEALSSTMGKNITSPAVVEKLQNVITSYENTDAFKKQGRGVIHPETLNKWKKRLVFKKESLKKNTNADVVNEKVVPSTPETITEPPSTITEVSPEVTSEGDTGTPKRRTSKNLGASIKKFAVIAEKSANAKEGEDVLPMEEVLSHVPKLVRKLQEEGYTTDKDFKDLVEEYPELEKIPQVSDAIKSGMYDQDTVVRDAGDDIVTPLSQAKLKEVYEDLYPGCKMP